MYSARAELHITTSELNIDIWNDNIQPFNHKKNDALDCSVLQTSDLCSLDVSFIRSLSTDLLYIVNNDKYID